MHAQTDGIILNSQHNVTFVFHLTGSYELTAFKKIRVKAHKTTCQKFVQQKFMHTKFYSFYLYIIIVMPIKIRTSILISIRFEVLHSAKQVHSQLNTLNLRPSK